MKRGDRIAYRQRQCAGCRFLSSGIFERKTYGFCLAQNKRLCDMDIWEDCKNYKPKTKKVKQK